MCFGSFRVELVVSLFHRVVDHHNFEVVMQCLSPQEAGCLLARVGWLKIYNPMKPEGAYALDLGRREERLVAKSLCALEVKEPGANWQCYSFQWDTEPEPMPGWELTQPWLSNEGMPSRGTLKLTYYSGEGQGLTGCMPNRNFRRALLQMVRGSYLVPLPNRSLTSHSSPLSCLVSLCIIIVVCVVVWAGARGRGGRVRGRRRGRHQHARRPRGRAA